jgi:hypothetical protein
MHLSRTRPWLMPPVGEHRRRYLKELQLRSEEERKVGQRYLHVTLFWHHALQADLMVGMQMSTQISKKVGAVRTIVNLELSGRLLLCI